MGNIRYVAASAIWNASQRLKTIVRASVLAAEEKADALSAQLSDSNSSRMAVGMILEHVTRNALPSDDDFPTHNQQWTELRREICVRVVAVLLTAEKLLPQAADFGLKAESIERLAEQKDRFIAFCGEHHIDLSACNPE